MRFILVFIFHRFLKDIINIKHYIFTGAQGKISNSIYVMLSANDHCLTSKLCNINSPWRGILTSQTIMTCPPNCQALMAVSAVSFLLPLYPCCQCLGSSLHHLFPGLLHYTFLTGSSSSNPVSMMLLLSQITQSNYPKI